MTRASTTIELHTLQSLTTKLHTEVTCHCHFYTPAICHGQIGYDVISFIQAQTPPDIAVYNFLNIPVEKHGLGLNAIPNRPRGGNTAAQYSMSTLLQLVLVSSPRKCLLGYEIVAMLKAHFKYFRETTKNWQVCNNSQTYHLCGNCVTLTLSAPSSTHSTSSPTSAHFPLLPISPVPNGCGLSTTHSTYFLPCVMVHVVIQLMTKERTTMHVDDM